MKHVLITLLGLAFASSASAATLTLYSAAPATLAKALARDFSKKTGDHVEVWTSSTGKVMARLAAEANHPHADVVMVAGWSAGLDLAQKGMVFPYHPAAIEKTLVKPAQTPAPFLPYGLDTVSMVFNTKALPAGAKLPNSWFDLTQPIWKDRITAPNPLLSGTASSFLTAFVDQYGNRAWQFLSALKANGTVWPGTNHAALLPVLAGERSGMLECVGHAAVAAKAQGNSVDLVYPQEGTIMIPRPILILKSAPDKKLAEEFVNFAMSPAGQKLVAKNNLYPARQGVPAKPIMAKIGSFKVIPVDWKKLAATQPAVLARFKKEILGQ
ncbi:extracellular solute-binding protein [Acidithiobacillus sp. IBUN Pt1247-S3]|uniref:extracellular solute-binding protein n=1 Tax=Acidithiobacillus sp. IBUN Pt1247-S3 TaxID=3166642 RepID=UPI0034E59AAE